MSTAKKVGTAGAGAILLAVAFIKPWEGLWTTAQVDTIGTGRPVTYCYGQTNEAGAVKAGTKFTPQQCSDLLAKSLPKYADEIAPCIKVPISDKEYAAYISFAYNVGSAGFCHSSAAARLNRGDHRGACDALMGWTKAQGRVVRGLVNRRTAERKLCLDGIGEPVNAPAVKPSAKPAPKVSKSSPPEPSFWEKLRHFFIKGN